jgi:hypothetical protein
MVKMREVFKFVQSSELTHASTIARALGYTAHNHLTALTEPYWIKGCREIQPPILNKVEFESGGNQPRYYYSVNYGSPLGRKIRASEVVYPVVPPPGLPADLPVDLPAESSGPLDPIEISDIQGTVMGRTMAILGPWYEDLELILLAWICDGAVESFGDRLVAADNPSCIDDESVTAIDELWDLVMEDLAVSG